MHPLLYDQFSQGALRAADSYSSAAQREAVMPLATGNADALRRLTQVPAAGPFPSPLRDLSEVAPGWRKVLVAAHTPADVEKRCEAGLTALLGADLVGAPPPRRSSTRTRDAATRTSVFHLPLEPTRTRLRTPT